MTPSERPFEVARVDTAIASGASQSAAIDLGGMHLAAILMPAAWTAAAITLLTSFDGVNFVPVYDAAGTEVSITTDASRHVVLDFAQTVALGQWIKLRSGTAGAPVNQAAARTLTLVARSF